MKKKTQAFTLLEVMIVVAIIGIITAYGLPRMKGFMTSTSLTSTTNDLVASLHLARSAAIRLQDKVVICSSANANTPAPTCGSVLTEWHEGWIVFHDLNRNTFYDGADELFQVHHAAEDNDVTITPVALGASPTNIVNYISFGPPAGEPYVANGAGQSGIFRICTPDDPDVQRGVLVNFSGRISSTVDSTVINSSCL